MSKSGCSAQRDMEREGTNRTDLNERCSSSKRILNAWQGKEGSENVKRTQKRELGFHSRLDGLGICHVGILRPL